MVQRLSLLVLALGTSYILYGASDPYDSGYTAIANGYTWHYYKNGDGTVFIDGEDVGCDDYFIVSAFSGGKKPSGNVTIPTYLDGKLVVGIGSDAFSSDEMLDDCKEITTITIPASIRWIWARFGQCYKLESFVVASGNENFTSVGGVLYDKTITSIVRVPKCITKVTIPEGVTGIPAYAFEECGELVSVAFPASMKSIGCCAFADCGKLSGVIIPTGVTEIAAGAFKNCSSVTSLKIPSNVRTIGGGVAYRYGEYTWWNGAFQGCTGLENLTVAEGLRTIGGAAFLGCTSLKTVSLPASLKSIGDCAFTGCDKLQSVVASVFPQSAYWGMYFYEKDLEDCDYDGWRLCSDPEYEPDPEYYEITEKHVTPTITPIPIKQLTIPAGTIEIEANAYSGCSTIETLTISDSVKKIGSSAFNGCTSLNRVDIGDLTNWYGIAFGDCAANPLWCGHHLYSNGEEVTALDLPSSMETIGANVFAGASFIESVKIPVSVTNIGASAFAGCTGLTRVDISDMAKWYKIAFGNETANPLCCGHRLFVNGEELTSLVIPNDVAEILPYTFNGSSITSVTVPQGVTRIGAGAFGGCSSLNRVNISDLAKWCTVAFANESANPLYCGNHLFLNGSEITSLVIPNGVQAIGNYAFINATALNSVKMPASVESVGTDAFKGCSGLTRVTIEDLSRWCAVTFANGEANPLSVAQHLYLNSNEITDLVVPSGVSSIGQYAFQNASHIASVKIPADVTTIGNDAFSGCSGVRSADVPAQFNLGNLFPSAKTSMERLTIPDGTTDIAANAYAGFGNIKEVIFPTSVTNVGSKAFADCAQLCRVDIADLTKWCAIHFADSEANPLVHNGSLFMDGVAVEHLVIPEEVTSISDYAFNNATGIVSVTAFSNVVDIGASSFAGCSGIRQVEIPSKLILSSVFPDAYATVTGIVISAGTEYIETNAYQGCVSVDRIVIPPSVKSIGTSAFEGCTELIRVDISDLKKWCDITFENDTANPLCCGHHLYLNGTEIVALSVPTDASTISDYAFYNASEISKVTIPSCVTSIGAHAFSGCTGIRTIDIPASYVVSAVFPSAYSAITSATIPDGTVSIVANGYKGCAAINRIAIPASVMNIGTSAFEGCAGLIRVDISDLTKWCGIAFGNNAANPLTCGHHLYLKEIEITALNVPVGVSMIADYAFYNASAISSVTIPSSVTSIAAHAFTGCTGVRTIDIPASYNVAMVFPSAYSAITQLTIPEGTTTIAANAYQGCSSVAAVVVPASVTTVGSGAFQDCGNLKSVTFKGQAPACGDNVFTGTSADMVVYAGTGTSGWTQWNGRPLAFVDPGSGSGSGSETVEKAQLTVTNVVIHYIVNSVVPEKTYPATYDTGFVNIITEVKSGGAVSVPATWMVNYPDYVTKFGADFTKSLMKTTGKYDGAGNPMCVWQDYVAGTDPTNPDDKFTASITVDKDGKITVSYSPEFTDANEKALRVYTTYGKKSLTEKDWVVVPTGSEADYNFFKVTVEMK